MISTKRVKVSIRCNRGVLQIVWTYPAGVRRYLGTGLPDNPQNRSIASWTASQIQQDIFTGHYDGTLLKYKIGSNTPAPQPNPEKSRLTFREIWAKFVDYRADSISVTTLHNQYKYHGDMVAACPHGLNHPFKVRAWAIDNYTYDSARRWVVALNAMGRWAVKTGLLEENPFEDAAIPKKRGKPRDIDPYTPEERDKIVAAFKDSQRYKYYWPLVQFLAFTGCRPSEALALRWKDISKNHLTFRGAVVRGEGGRISTRQGLKSQADRQIRLSPKIEEAIGDRGQPDDLVFPAPNGGLINWKNFVARGWYTTIEAIPDLPKKKPYSLRSSYITAALAAGYSPQDVAKLVGNSAGVIYSNYAGITRALEQPNI